MNAKKDFDITVIMPIFNMEEYLDDSIGSIISQKLGFEDHIQLLLINDGSTDSSEKICLQYKSKYPDNINYVYQDNAGVASAMNTGLKYAKGDFVNFFGADDIWSPDAFLAFLSFFKKDEAKDIDLASMKAIFFGSRTGDHPLNFKYKETKIVDLEKEPNYIQLISGTCLFRRRVFDELSALDGLQYEEDALLINQLLLKRLKYAVISDGTYYYRRRGSESLALASVNNLVRYLESPYKCFKHLFELSRQLYGKVLPFIQYTVMYEMQWRFAEKLPENLSEEQRIEYERILKELLSDISNSCIRKQRDIGITKKAFIFKLKYGDDIFSKCKVKNGFAYYGRKSIMRVDAQSFYKVFNTWIENDTLFVEGLTYASAFTNDFTLRIINEKKEVFYPELSDFPVYDLKAFNDDYIYRTQRFVFKLPLYNRAKYTPQMRFGTRPFFTVDLLFSIFGKLNSRVDHSYWWKDGFILKYFNRKIHVYLYSLKTLLVSEWRLEKDIKQLVAESDEKIDTDIIKLRRKAIRNRLRRSNKKIWIVSDRYSKAGDNGENFFKYAIKQPIADDVDIYFLQDPTSSDYERLLQYGKILDPHSKKYLELFLNADLIISSHADAAVINPFKRLGYYLMDLFNFEYVYLQHGVMPGDLTHWLNKMNKNIRLLIASAKSEYEQLLTECYGYTEREVKLAGMTRHDALDASSKSKLVVFLPTWRQDLAGRITEDGRDREYSPEFKNTYYCKFYNDLINDQRLIEGFKRNGYKGEFYVHPSFKRQTDDFVGNDTISVGDGLADYESILNKASLMVTDYSSVAFDFGYLRKPIIYCQFDIEEWTKHHFYEKGYFDYFENGFGPVVVEKDDIVDAILNALDNDCALDDFYRKRADDFFSFNDKNNCKRVFDCVMELVGD